MSGFLFDGRSRVRKMTLAKDHHKSRSSILTDSLEVRQRREEEVRRMQAAQRLQRAIRHWLAVQNKVWCALEKMNQMSAGIKAILTSGPSSSACCADEAAKLSMARVEHLKVHVHTACCCLSFVLRHQSHIPLRATLPSSSYAPTDPLAYPHDAGVLREGDPVIKSSEEGVARSLTPSVSPANRSAKQQSVVERYSNTLYKALREGIGNSDNEMLQCFGDAEADGVSVSIPSKQVVWQGLFRRLPKRDVTLLLCVLLQQISRLAPSGMASRNAFPQEMHVVWCLAQWMIADIVDCNSTFQSLCNEEEGVAPRGAAEQMESGMRERSQGDVALDDWPAVSALTEALNFLRRGSASLSSGARALCAELLQPLAAAFPPSVVSLIANSRGDSTCQLLDASAFVRVCWACLCEGYTDEEYQQLTPNVLAVLLGAGDTSAAAAAPCATGRAARELDACFTALVAECYRRTALDTELTMDEEVKGMRGGHLRARVLGRLVRLLPRIHAMVGATPRSDTDTSPAARSEVVKCYLLSVSCLTERLCQDDFFVEGILADHYAYNTGKQPHGPSEVHSGDENGTPGHPLRGHYRLPTSYLFSSEGGLYLLQLLTAEDGGAEQQGLQRSPEPTIEPPLEATPESPPSDDGGSGYQEEIVRTAQDTETTAPSTLTTAVISQINTSPSSLQWPSSARVQQSPLEILCNVFAWPIFTFSKPRYRDYQQQTLALYAKLVRTPQLLRRLWILYSQSCEGLRAVLPPGDVLQQLCQSTFPGAQEPERSYGSTAHGPQRGRQGPALAASASLQPSPPRLPTWETHPRYPLAFYDPHASLSIFFFVLLAYYANVSDFAGEIRRGDALAVLSVDEICALVLALKEIVHRAHLYGVVPDSNSEAVAHAACQLLSRLHIVNEADPFGAATATATSLWVSISPAAASAVVPSLVRIWDADSAAVVSEEAEEVSDGEDVAQRTHVATAMENRTSAGVALRGTPATSAAAHMRPPGDVAFHNSREWKHTMRYTKLLVHTPFLVPFSARALLLSSLLEEGDRYGPSLNERRLLVHRGRVFGDAFELFHNNPLQRDVLDIHFVSEDGLEEPGYGRGVYREFMVSLCKEGFAPEYGLFRQTQAGEVYPNSSSAVATNDPQHLHKFRFLGVMVGRAMRDGLLQEVPFALHFRNAILSRRNNISNLKSFDAELYQRLMSLTHYSEEELQAMGLKFEYTVEALGVAREVELVPGGSQIEVTPRNCLFYVHLVADLKLNREAAEQTRAFCHGLRSVIDASRLRLFDSVEIGNLFCGDSSGQIDLEDWKEHTVYDKPEDAQTLPVCLFWDVVESLTREQQRKLLKFATSTTLPPLLGFHFLAPPFKIQLLATTVSGPDRLPSAATCFSTLKLPPYQDYATARAKIIAAIEETGTFEFS